MLLAFIPGGISELEQVKLTILDGELIIGWLAIALQIKLLDLK
jgi:hypothetical protein